MVKGDLRPRIERKVVGPIPLIMQLDKETVLACINQELAAQGQDRLPPDTEISVRVPGGGDWSHTDLELDHQITLDLRWKQPADD